MHADRDVCGWSVNMLAKDFSKSSICHKDKKVTKRSHELALTRGDRKVRIKML